MKERACFINASHYDYDRRFIAAVEGLVPKDLRSLDSVISTEHLAPFLATS